MRVFVQTKQISKRRREVAPVAYELPGTPDTLRQLISMMVHEEVRRYQERQKNPSFAALSAEEIEDLSRVGRIGFGIPFGSSEVNVEEAVDAALLGFQDGLFRVFINDCEVEGLDESLTLRENDVITIIRLVMLTGGFF